jgi:hypothetical protein
MTSRKAALELDGALVEDDYGRRLPRAVHRVVLTYCDGTTTVMVVLACER